MKLAVLGGSFNPLHIGHAMVADTVCTELGYDKVLFVPTYIPPHKMINSSITAQERYKMVDFFCKEEGSGRFEAESCEIDRGGVSYTADTLEYLSEKYFGKFEGKLGLILGEESAAEFRKWKNPEKILKLADLIVARRKPLSNENETLAFSNKASGQFEGDFKVSFNPQKIDFPFIMLENALLPVSSTEVRSRIGEGKSWKYMVPSAIYDIINREYLGKYKN